MPRKNRLGYIFISDHILNMGYKDAQYLHSTHCGDHLIILQVALTKSQQRHGKGYWKFNQECLEYPDIKNALIKEAKQILTDIRVAHNPGIIWRHGKDESDHN